MQVSNFSSSSQSGPEFDRMKRVRQDYEVDPLERMRAKFEEQNKPKGYEPDRLEKLRASVDS